MSDDTASKQQRQDRRRLSWCMSSNFPLREQEQGAVGSSSCQVRAVWDPASCQALTGAGRAGRPPLHAGKGPSALPTCIHSSESQLPPRHQACKVSWENASCNLCSKLKTQFNHLFTRQAFIKHLQHARYWSADTAVNNKGKGLPSGAFSPAGTSKEASE